MCGVLDFSLYYTHDNSPCGLPLQNVSLKIHFFCSIITLPSSKNPHFQNKIKFKTFLVKISLICMRMKNHFRIKGIALNLVLIQRPWETLKWPSVVLSLVICKGRF